jgi:hypothetical protein
MVHEGHQRFVALPVLTMFLLNAFASAGDRGFDVNLASLQRDAALLERARTAFSKEAETPKGRGPLSPLAPFLYGLPFCAVAASGARPQKPFSWNKPSGKFAAKGAGKSPAKGAGKSRGTWGNSWGRKWESSWH